MRLHHQRMPMMFGDQEFATEEDRAIYALGIHLASKVPQRTLQPAEVETIVNGFRAKLTGEHSVVDDAYVPMAINLLQGRELDMAKRAIFAGDQVLAAAEEEPGAVQTPGGAVLMMLREGAGAKPGAFDTVQVHFEGRLVDGTVFDSTAQGDPVSFPLDRVIQGWSEGLTLMSIGSKARLTVPPALGSRVLGCL